MQSHVNNAITVCNSQTICIDVLRNAEYFTVPNHATSLQVKNAIVVFFLFYFTFCTFNVSSVPAGALACYCPAAGMHYGTSLSLLSDSPGAGGAD